MSVQSLNREQFDAGLLTFSRRRSIAVSRSAVDDSQVELTAGRITKKQFDELTNPQMRAALDKDWETKCNKADRSSRQVRVLEVCHAEETECEPLLNCLENLNKRSEPAGK